MTKVMCSIPFLFFVLISCNNSPDTLPETSPAPDTGQVVVVSEEVQGGNVFPDPVSFIVTDTVKRVDIITCGVFHSDEVEKDIREGSWRALYKKSSYFVHQVELRAKRVHDPILDETEDIKTGWEISIAEDYDPIILFRNHLMGEGTVECAELPEQVYPGDSVWFDYGQKEYLLFAAGVKLGDESKGESPYVQDHYALYLRAEKNGLPVTQQLVAFDFMDEAMVSVLFCGDLDYDGFPDFLLNNVNKYNSSNPTLYLSSETKNEKLLDIVGWRRSVGC